MKIVPKYWDEELECGPVHVIDERRTLKMQKHLRYAYQNSAYYKASFDKAGIRPEKIVTLDDFRQFVPYLNHRDLIENQRRNPPFGDFLAVGLKDVVRIYHAPGPVLMPFSLNDMDNYINSAANGLYICGARRGDIADITSAYQWQLAGTMIDDALRRIGCAVVPGGAGMTRTHINVMKRVGVTVVFAFPSFAMQLAETAREMGLDPASELKIRLIILGPEYYEIEDKKKLEEAFAAQVRGMYGEAETGFVAAECPEDGGLHCFTETFIELIDPETGLQVPDGEAGEIVVTDLARRAMPMIRYRTGDIAEGLNTEPCKCGRTSPRLGRLIGRIGDIPRVKGTLIVVEPIADAVARYEGLGRFRIVVEREGLGDKLILQIESQRSSLGNNAERMLSEDVRAATLLRTEVRLVPEGSIGPDEPILVDKRFDKSIR